jgi:hypothetical protein
MATIEDALVAMATRVDALEDALRDIALAKPVSECRTFRPDLNSIDHANFIREFAHAALAATEK